MLCAYIYLKYIVVIVCRYSYNYIGCNGVPISGRVRHYARENVATLTLSGVHKDATIKCKLNNRPFVECKLRKLLTILRAVDAYKVSNLPC